MRIVSHLSRLLRDIAEDAVVRARYQADPTAVAADYGLSDEERAALISGDDARISLAIAGRIECKIIWGHPDDEEEAIVRNIAA